MLLMNVLTLQYKKVSQSITIVVKDTLDGRTVYTIENEKIAYFLTLDVGMIPIEMVLVPVHSLFTITILLGINVNN